MNDIETIFKNFQGHWTIEREMKSFEDELLGVAKGNAEFKQGTEDHVLAYQENGKAVFHSKNDAANETIENETEFFRLYSYRLQDGQIQIYHGGGPQKGQFYQSYILNKEGNGLDFITTHICGADLYQGFYELIDQNHFILTTQIEGPRKNSIIKTRFQRC